ncbi:MAG: ABC transporter permease [Lachnospiraceae bacterium]|nr:ABC transporter permease [Lachnospiraceae bacterium]
MQGFISLFQAAVFFGTVIMFGCIGEIITEKAGNLNLGVPGIMYLGGISSLSAVFIYEGSTDTPSSAVCVILALLASFIGASFGGLIYAFLTITLRANQNVTGLALSIFGSGVANFFGGSLNTLAGRFEQISVPVTSAAFRQNIAPLANMGVIGKLFFSYGFMVYLAVILAVAVQLFMQHTMAGLNLRTVGENPQAADAAGINVTVHKYLAICIGAGICGFGGVYYVMDYIKGTWANDGSIEKLGWLSVALVIFATWKAKNAIWGAYLFGVLYWMYLYIPGLTRASQEIFKMLPYVVTIVVLVFTSLTNSREKQPPAALGQSYFREER